MDQHLQGRFRPLNASPPIPYPLPAPPPLDQSLNFASNFLATISAAFPLGARMIGTVPIVTTTLNNPLAIRSDSDSISTSVAEGEFRMAYEGGASVSRGAGSLSPLPVAGLRWFAFVPEADPDASATGMRRGKRENKEGLGTIKSRF